MRTAARSGGSGAARGSRAQFVLRRTRSAPLLPASLLLAILVSVTVTTGLAGFAGRALPAAAHARLARAPATPIQISGQFGAARARADESVIRSSVRSALGSVPFTLATGHWSDQLALPTRARCVPATTDPGRSAQWGPVPRHAHRRDVARSAARWRAAPRRTAGDHGRPAASFRRPGPHAARQPDRHARAARRDRPVPAAGPGRAVLATQPARYLRKVRSGDFCHIRPGAGRPVRPRAWRAASERRFLARHCGYRGHSSRPGWVRWGTG